LYYYNPNTYPKEEYLLRLRELKKLIHLMGIDNFVEGEYNPCDYTFAMLGHENEGEGSERCVACYKLRLEHTAKYAASNKFDFFTTTLSVSPKKNAIVINRLGEEFEHKYGVRFLYSDFKKRDGYARSVELSKEYKLYRQDYCGCIKSKERSSK
jgi:Uncharacterized protein conserved in bacteria